MRHRLQWFIIHLRTRGLGKGDEPAYTPLRGMEPFTFITPPLVVEHSIVKNVSVCLSVCLSVYTYFRNLMTELHTNFSGHVVYGRGLALFLRHYNMLCTSGFLDGVIFLYMDPVMACCYRSSVTATSSTGNTPAAWYCLRQD